MDRWSSIDGKANLRPTVVPNKLGWELLPVPRARHFSKLSPPPKTRSFLAIGRCLHRSLSDPAAVTVAPHCRCSCRLSKQILAPMLAFTDLGSPLLRLMQDCRKSVLHIRQNVCCHTLVGGNPSRLTRVSQNLLTGLILD